MATAGFAVPAGFAVTTEAYRRFMAAGGLESQAHAARAVPPDDLPAIEAAAADMASAIQDCALPADVEAAVREAYARIEQLDGSPAAPVAVRSSGTSEDLGAASFAGQYETFLWVSGADAVLDHLRRCWCGLFSAPVLTYRPAAGDAAPGEPSMAVGVQRMVQARAAGVMFTLDPLNGDRAKVVIEGAWGLGEAVVGGEVTPDRYRVHKVTFELIERAIATKEVECVFDPVAGGVRMAPVPAERRDESCLDDAQVGELARLAKRIERHRGAPVDIEWAVGADGSVNVLQVRPETVWSRKRKESSGSGVQQVLAKFMSGTVTNTTRGDGSAR
jgi:pyruvate,water dikinase